MPLGLLEHGRFVSVPSSDMAGAARDLSKWLNAVDRGFMGLGSMPAADPRFRVAHSYAGR